MKQAIEFLRAKGITVDNSGYISEYGSFDLLDLMSITNDLEDSTMSEDSCFTIIEDQLTQIEI